MKSLDEREAFRAKQKEREAKEREHGGDQQPERDEKQAQVDAANAKPVPEGDAEGQLVNEVSGKDPASVVASGPKRGADDKNTPADEFDAKEYVDDTADAIKADLGNISGENLTAVEEAEKAGKKRTSVLDAVASERKKREAAGNNWNANK